MFNMVPGAVGVAILSTVFVTVGEMFSMPFMNTYWISRTNNGNRGQYAGLYTVAWASAQVLGPSTGSAFADKFGFTALWWMITGISIACALGFWLLHRVGERVDTEQLAAAK
jgi:MFS family permease